jgi:hypothetical protein
MATSANTSSSCLTNRWDRRCTSSVGGKRRFCIYQTSIRLCLRQTPNTAIAYSRHRQARQTQNAPMHACLIQANFSPADKGICSAAAALLKSACLHESQPGSPWILHLQQVAEVAPAPRRSSEEEEEGGSSSSSSSYHPGLSLPSPLRLRGFRHDHHPMHHAAPLQDKPSPRRTSHKRGWHKSSKEHQLPSLSPLSHTLSRLLRLIPGKEKKPSPPLAFTCQPFNRRCAASHFVASTGLLIVNCD